MKPALLRDGTTAFLAEMWWAGRSTSGWAGGLPGHRAPQSVGLMGGVLVGLAGGCFDP